MTKPLRILVPAALAVLLLWLCSFQVGQNEAAFVTRFGDPRRLVTEPGLHFKWPAPIDQLIRVDLRMRVLDLARTASATRDSEYLTQDKKNVEVEAFMAWEVEDPLKFVRTVSTSAGAEVRLEDVLRSVVGDVLSSYPFAALVSLDGQDASAAEVVAEITAAAAAKARENFGIRVAAVRLKRISFPTDNKNSVFRRMEAERDAIAEGYRSEGAEQYEKIKAEADREQARLLSEARRAAEEVRGEAEAQALRIRGEAIAVDPALYEFLLQLDMWEKALGEGSTLVVPNDHELLDVLKPSSIPQAPPAHDAPEEPDSSGSGNG